MDTQTIERIKKMHPALREELLEQYEECNNLLGKGVRLRFAYTYRSPQEQDELFKKRPKVTNAKGWQSIHNYGMAFDIVLLYDKDGNGTFESASWDTKKDGDGDGKSDWMTVVNYFKSKGWEWGGDWASFRDEPHFQKAFGHGNWKHWKAKIDAGQAIEDGGIKYPKI
jgi:peptidoglycan L-alanyl-D-glutamate endopeptidase CwlK